MSRTAKLVFLALAVTLPSPALAQIGLRTANLKPDSNNDVKLTLTRSNVSASTCNVKDRWFPTVSDESNPLTKDDTLCFWDQKDQQTLKNGQFVNSGKSLSAATEIISDAFGPVRVALSTAVAATTDEDQAIDDEDEPTPEQDRALNLLATNGGNLAFTASFPFYARPIGGGQFVWNSYLRIATNVSALGGDTETTLEWGDVNGNVELAFTELKLDLLSNERRFNLLGYLKAGAIAGTQKFAESLHAEASRTFFHGQAGAGLRVGQLLTMYLAYNWYSDSDIPGRGATLTFALTRAGEE
jgi:hypothetical protein